MLHHYTMESTVKPFDLRSVPVQAIAEPVKHRAEMGPSLPQGQADLVLQRENTYNGKCIDQIDTFVSYFCMNRKIIVHY